jgi:Ca2+-binding RTX toxin-like protein
MLAKTALGVTLALGLAMVPSAASAAVATSCSFDAGTATVSAVIGSGDGPTLIRNDTAIEFGGVPCGAATITNTDTITVLDPDPNTGESLTVSLAGGRLEPGKTPEDDGTDEIEISIAGSFAGPLTLIGSDAADHFYVCAGDINLNDNVSGDGEILGPSTLTVTTVDGGKGNDVLRTRMYQSVVSGGEGDDVLYPMDFQASTYSGGPGNDELSMTGQIPSSFGEIHALGGGDATVVQSSSVSDTAHGIETFEGFSGPTKFYGSSSADHFIGTQYNDWFQPSGGNDIIDGGSVTLGHSDYDILSAGGSSSGVTFDMGTQTATGEGTDTFSHIEGLQGSPQADTFKGDPTDWGILSVEGNGGNDVLDFTHVSNGQTVYLGPDAPVAPLWAIGITDIIGSPFRDHFFFGSGSVPAHFEGGNGNDRLVGGPLNDTLSGGRGADRIVGKAGTDFCDGGTGADTITGCEQH